jgi:hypothetical protein
LWLSPLWRGTGPLFEQSTIPFTQEWFVLSLIEIGLLPGCFGRGRFFFFKFQCIFTLLLLSPLGQQRSPSFVHLQSPPQRMNCANSG